MANRQQKVSRALFGLGVLSILGGLGHWWLGVRTFARLPQTTCTVLDKRTDLELLVSSGQRGSGPARATGYREEVLLLVALNVGEKRYTFEEDFVYDWASHAHLGLNKGTSHPCRYDPANPVRATVRTHFNPSSSHNLLALGGFLLAMGVMVPEFAKLAALNSELRHRRF